MSRLILCLFLTTLRPALGADGTLKSLTDRFYQTLDANSAVACFRLTNATSQIGCSASTSSVRGILYLINSTSDLDDLLKKVPHPPFIALLEPEYFTKDNVVSLYQSSRVNGIVVRYHDGSSPPDVDGFSPEKTCPNDGFGSGRCDHQWNPAGSAMSFMDFKDFPIFAVGNRTFTEQLVKCYTENNVGLTGGVSDYPLCSIELYADMDAAVDTPTCFRRANLPMPYLNNVAYCDPLGDQNVWGTMFQLKAPVKDIIMLATKVDSNSFFLDHSYGANSEVAGIVTLLAVVEQLGRLKRSDSVQLMNTSKPIIYTFFHGESWDYIGSSRMVYDMQHDAFPYKRDSKKTQLPLIGLDNITTFFELSQLGMDTDSDTLFIHGDMNSSLVPVLRDALREYNLTLSGSTSSDLCHLPPASLQRFVRGKNTPCAGGSSDFQGSVLATFNHTFTNRFYHSRYDNFYNLHSVLPVDEIASRLADIATGVARSAVVASQPNCANGTCSEDALNEVLVANSTLIQSLLHCFLVDSNCTIFQNVLTRQLAENHLYQQTRPLSRYITSNQVLNLETILIYQLVAYLSANREENITNYVNCQECYRRFNKNDQTVNATAMQWESGDKDSCLCVESYTYQHKAESPAFEINDYASTEYSTWAESRWSVISARIYLVTYTGQEVGILFGGTAMSLVTFIFAFLCKRRADDIFEPKLYGLLQE